MSAKLEREVQSLRDGVRRIQDELKKFNSKQSANLEDFHSLFTTLETIRSSTASSSSSAAVSTAALGSFSKWFKESGGILSKVAPHPGFAEGVGMISLEEIHENDLIISVPYSLMLTEETAAESPSFLALGNEVLAHFPELSLALQLLHEKFSLNSKWFQYIQVLPKTFSTPFYWTWEELSQLSGTTSISDCINCLKVTANQYCLVFDSLDNTRPSNRFMSLRNFTWSEFAWAISVLMTRKNRVPKMKNRTEANFDMIALIPMWDFCNHQQGTVSTFATQLGSECKSMRHYVKGEQFFIHYGNRPNYQLFSHNGFIIENNQSDVFIVPIKNIPANKRSVQYFITSSGEPSPELMEYISQNNVNLIDLCKEQLTKYPTTIQQDLEILKSSYNNSSKSLSFVSRCAIALRILEKRAFSKAANVEVVADNISELLTPQHVTEKPQEEKNNFDNQQSASTSNSEQTEKKQQQKGKKKSSKTHQK